MPYLSSRSAALLIASIGLLSIGGCDDPKARAAQREAGVVADAHALQGEAQRACLCERTRGTGSQKECWSKFEAAIAPKHAEEEDSSCDPVYAVARSWSENGADRYVVTQYRALISPAEVVLCTPAEARVAEDAINAAGNDRAAMAKADRLVLGIAHGQPFAAVPGRPDCG